MPEEPKSLSPRRAVGWSAIASLILAAIVLYFLYGRSVPLLSDEPAADVAPAPVTP